MDRLVFNRSLALLALLVALSAPVLAADSGGEPQFGGVGLQVVPTINGQLVVLQVLPDSPAAAGGMLPGDLIIRVDDFPLQGSEFAAVVSKYLWGPVGSKVTLHYLRPGVAGPHAVALQRSSMTPKITVLPSTRDGAKD
jgi:carboxyl-terminal processing protease